MFIGREEEDAYASSDYLGLNRPITHCTAYTLSRAGRLLFFGGRPEDYIDYGKMFILYQVRPIFPLKNHKFGFFLHQLSSFTLTVRHNKPQASKFLNASQCAASSAAVFTNMYVFQDKLVTRFPPFLIFANDSSQVTRMFCCKKLQECSFLQGHGYKTRYRHTFFFKKHSSSLCTSAHSAYWTTAATCCCLRTPLERLLKCSSYLHCSCSTALWLPRNRKPGRQLPLTQQEL